MGERFVCIGAAMADLTLSVPHLPSRGRDVLGQSGGISPGGCALNVATALRRLGGKVTLVSRTGHGPFGDLIRRFLQDEGVVLHSSVLDGRDSGWTLAVVEPDGERTFLTAPGAEARLGEAELAGLDLTGAGWIYVSGYELVPEGTGEALAAFLSSLPRTADGTPLRLAFDPGPLEQDIPRRRLDAVLRRSDLLLANEEEATRLAGVSDPAEACRRLSDLVGGTAVVHIGARGCLAAEKSGVPVAVNGYQAPVVDTNGAGDAHAAGVMFGLAHGLGLTEACRFANGVAALTVTTPGAQAAPYPDHLERLDPWLWEVVRP